MRTLLVLTLLLFGAARASAQGFAVAAPDSVDKIIWIIHQVAKCWIVAPGFTTEDLVPAQRVGLAWGTPVGSTALMPATGAAIVLADGGVPMPEFSPFVADTTFAGAAAELRPDLEWAGFTADVLAPVAAGQSVEVHFDIDCEHPVTPPEFLAVEQEILESGIAHALVDLSGNPLPPGPHIAYTLSAEIQDHRTAAPLGAQFLLRSIYPNPSSSVLWLDARVPEGQPYRIELFDLRGRLRNVWTGRSESAALIRPLNLDARLPCGSYWLQLRVGAQRVRGRFLILR